MISLKYTEKKSRPWASEEILGTAQNYNLHLRLKREKVELISPEFTLGKIVENANKFSCKP